MTSYRRCLHPQWLSGAVLAVLASCGFGSDEDDDDSIQETWVFDSAAELAATGSMPINMAVDASGALMPMAYNYGGLVARGLADTRVWTTDPSWDAIAAQTPSGIGMWRGEQITNTTALDQLGITAKTMLTIWLEGEVWLEAGAAESFRIASDGTAFVDLARPETRDYQRVVTGSMTVPVTVAVTGWHPIRVGYSRMGPSLGTNFEFTHSDVEAGPLIAWARTRLRARAGELSGVLANVFPSQILGSRTGRPMLSQFEQRALLADTTFMPLPPGATSDDWSARYLGQVYVERDGMYELTIVSSDGNRGRIGSGRGELSWQRDADSAMAATTTVAAALTAGWNDLAVDYNQVMGPRSLGIRFASTGAAAAAIPRLQLRPVESSDDRLVFAIDNETHIIEDGGGAAAPGTSSFVIDGFAGETVGSVDVTAEISAENWDQIRIDLETPGGTRVLVRGTFAPAGGVMRLIQIAIPAGATGTEATLLGGAAAGTWKLLVYDTSTQGGGGNPQLRNAALTLHTRGGPDKIARAASWLSPVLELPTNITALTAVTIDERIPAGAASALLVRTCADVACTDAAWSPAAVGKLTAARYAQLRVDLTSDGNAEPEVRKLSLVYRRTR